MEPCPVCVRLQRARGPGPLLLASAFLGREKLLDCYREAFALKYRLYSFGDAMLIL